MAKFLTHEAVDGGIFNRDHATASGQCAAWSAELQNTPEILSLLLDRMEHDFTSLSVKMRFPYKYAHLVSWLPKVVAE